MPSFFSKEYITAKASYNRWLVPPAALAIHLSIGMAYGFSVFWKPLGSVLTGPNGKALAACSAGAATFADKLHGTLRALTATDCNWTQFDLGWMYTLFFVLLGFRSFLGKLVRASGSQKSRACIYIMLVWWIVAFRIWHIYASALDDVAWQWRHWWDRLRLRIYFPRIDSN